MAACGTSSNNNKETEDSKTNTVQDTIEQASNVNSKIWVIEGDTLQMFFEEIEDDNYPKDADENSNVYIEVYFKGKVILEDTDYYIFKENNVKYIKYKNTNYVLITIMYPMIEDRWLVFEIKNHKIKFYDNVVKKNFKDIDNDGIIEVGGSGIVEAVCLDCDSAFYNPVRIYKLGNIFTFDSINSRKLTEKIYDRFLGYEYLDSIVLFKRNKK